MRELFDIIRSNPWPFAENFGRGIQGDGAVSDFSDADGGDGGCGGDGGGGD
jgi:hypothetical protein